MGSHSQARTFETGTPVGEMGLTSDEVGGTPTLFITAVGYAITRLIPGRPGSAPQPGTATA